MLKGASGKVKMPYKMYIGMQKKTIEKLKKTSATNQAASIIAESGGSKKQRLMTALFARREENKHRSKVQARTDRKAKFDKLRRKARQQKQELIRTMKGKQSSADHKPWPSSSPFTKH